jgi:UDP-N-acetylmuramoyl-tripeptide--D-alanyl-D-alanine ligase
MPELQSAVLAELPKLGSLLVKGSRFMHMERLVQSLNSLTPQEQEAAHAA